EVPADRWGDFGLNPEGWFPSQRGEINWFDPAVAELPDERRWPVLVAAYAACVDNSRRLYCPRSRALHSVLYAALLRKRPYYAADKGAVEFFEQACWRLVERRLHPLYDSVLEAHPVFAPELRLLDGEEAAYERDLRRARRTVVYVQKAASPFE